MIIDKFTLLALVAPRQAAAHRLAVRWSAAASRDPALAEDIIRLGGILAHRPMRMEDGVEIPDPVDPIRLAIQQGRRELAQELLAAMSITPFELSQLVERDDEMD